MSTNNFVKGECRQCAGHLEFPANAVGATIACPHCGRSTELTVLASLNKTTGSRWKWLLLAGGVLMFASGLATGFFLVKKTGAAAIAKPPPVVTAPAKPAAIPAKPPADGEHLHEFAISPAKLEKTPGSSLVYVTGKVRNLTSRQRFGVKIEFQLFDTNHTVIGKATDYHPMLEPDGVWRFKAMVMEAKVASVQLHSITEDQP